MCEQKPLGGDWKGHFVYLPLASGDGKRYLCGVYAREDREVVSLALRGEVWLLVEREALQKSLPVNVLTGGPLLMPLLTSQSVGGWGRGGMSPHRTFLRLVCGLVCPQG